MPPEKIRGLNFVRNSYETARRIREGVNHHGEARQSFGSQLKATGALFSIGAAATLPKNPKSDPDVTLNNLSSAGIYVPEEFNRGSLGAFVTKGRIGGTGAPAPPFLVASGLSRTIETNRRKVQPFENSSSLQWSNSARDVANRSQLTEETDVKVSTHLTNLQSKDRMILATSQKEYFEKMPSHKRFTTQEAGKSSCRRFVISSTGVVVQLSAASEGRL